jgi:hypothetical protein
MGNRALSAVCLALSLLVPSFSFCEETSVDRAGMHVTKVGIRWGITGPSVIGEEQQETFQEYSMVAHVRLPWDWRSPSGWGLGTKLIASAGALRGGGEEGFIGSLIPALEFGKKDGWISIEAGFGGALLSHHKFGRQDFGGPFQIAATVGASVPVSQRIAVGYRLQHYSDAEIYGGNSRGGDFHMLELTYRY